MNRRQALGTLALAFLTAPLAARAQTPDASPSLRSSVLTLVLRPSPYHFEVVERSTGKVLLSHQATGMREGTSILSGRRPTGTGIARCLLLTPRR